MPSYISSSSIKNSSKTWGIAWVAIFVLYSGIMISYETYLKNAGFQASIENNNDLWSWYRSGVLDDNHEFVIVGASRSQLGINIPYLKKKLNDYKVTQLSVNGNYPMSAFQSLADDTNFKGVVLVSISAQALEDRYLDMQEKQTAYYKNNSTFYKSLDAYITALLHSKFRFMHPMLRLKDILTKYEKNHKFPKAFHITANPDQSISANYDLVDQQQLYNHFVKQKEKNYIDSPPSAPEVWKKNIDLLTKYSNSIRERGGKVILVRFPTFAGHWLLDEEYYPKSKYWDLIQQTPGLTAIHFSDIKEMSSFTSPDSSHIDQKDTVRFTEVLFNYLLENNYL